jgi:hypothetical protein
VTGNVPEKRMKMFRKLNNIKLTATWNVPEKWMKMFRKSNNIKLTAAWNNAWWHCPYLVKFRTVFPNGEISLHLVTLVGSLHNQLI